MAMGQNGKGQYGLRAKWQRAKWEKKLGEMGNGRNGIGRNEKTPEGPVTQEFLPLHLLQHYGVTPLRDCFRVAVLKVVPYELLQ